MSDKKIQILEASIDLFADEGFWNTPTTRIAQHAGVGTGTLFNYFGSKEGLIDAVYTQLKREWAKAVLTGWPHGGSVKEQLEHMWFRYIDWAVKNPERYALKQQLGLSELVHEEHEQEQPGETSLAFLVDTYNRAVSARVLVDLPVDYFSMLLLAQVEAAIHYAQLHGLQDMALVKHVGLSFQLFWNSVSTH